VGVSEEYLDASANPSGIKREWYVFQAPIQGGTLVFAGRSPGLSSGEQSAGDYRRQGGRQTGTTLILFSSVFGGHSYISLTARWFSGLRSRLKPEVPGLKSR
jgi:hypothetical protein